ncbi:bromodomain-containing protein DDB_G0280777-like isoform X1 [Aphidius gifuensis]|uniref:bromodomain-containing protein DDB_G0280777-like isoform X1 n=1 Tax=Aphidius gifuensis TaxID=684658 RepID=UPI001CDC8B06|nr:bromodomain-containing protein DDB_G0280777-like isoform X1 [Aphidius gifuensis]
MKIISTYLLLMVIGFSWRETMSTCVLESDFGFTINCAFKKSGLFRVRNLGGVKGYLGLGFTVGDELGFPQSLSNLESSKRRSVQAGNQNFIGTGNQPVKNQVVNDKRLVPPFKPLPPGASRPMSPQLEHQRLVVQQNSSALRTIPAPSLAAMQDAAIRQQIYHQQIQHQQQQQKIQQQQMQYQQMQQQMQEQQKFAIQEQQKLAMQEQQKQFAIQQQQRINQKLRQQQRVQQEAVAMQMLNEQRHQQQEVMRQKFIQEHKLLNQPPKNEQVSQIVHAVYPQVSTNTINTAQNQVNQGNNMMASNSGLPAFVAIPQSLSELTNRISNSPTLLVDSVNEVSKDELNQLSLPSEEMAATVNEMTLQSLNPNASGDIMKIKKQQNNNNRQSVSNSASLTPIHGNMEISLKSLAEASNMTLEALESAILLRQQQLMGKHQATMTTTSATTTTTSAPVKNYNSGLTKVMNAPREYYPIGYDKNFDDNFSSRVDLPDTSFYCGDQKHFPGLYGDEDLGCMVFHVCALTDDGLIMKSFLCPESTLFDQTILKCNWWFYVECKTTKSLYDSNIPISKSYQLMKSLAFFAAYKNHDNSTTAATVEETKGS